MAFSLLAATVWACGSSGSGTDNPLPDKDAIWMHFGSGDYELKLTDYEGACPIESMGVSHKASSTYVAVHFTLPAGTDSLPAGTYMVAPDGTPVEIELKSLDAQCNKVITTIASSGTFTIDTAMTAAGGALKGSYAIDFPDGTSSQGTFNAAACTLGSAAGTCVP